MWLIFLLLFVVLVCNNGFEYGKDKVRTLCEDKPVIIHGTGRYGWTKWPLNCPYENRIHITCYARSINPNAVIQMWEYNGEDGKFIANFNWTHVDGKNGYFDAHVGVSDFGYDGKWWAFWMDGYIKLYFTFNNTCSDGAVHRRVNLLSTNFLF
uniref:S-protein homolog n=1 Tax=Panagrolaimus sp. JU765 TaxID=591449 RepID=A0AC34Q9A2_9BILA